MHSRFSANDISLFFALKPPAPLLSAIDALGGTVQRAHRLRGRRIMPDRLHNTVAPVHDPGCSLADIVARARAAAARLRFRRFAVRFEWTGSFDVHRAHYPLVLRGEEGLHTLTEFQHALGTQMTRAGFKIGHGYTPHITLLWADRPVEDYPIAPIGWTVTDFVLVASLKGQSHHACLGRWPLNG